MWHAQRLMLGAQVKRYHTYPIAEQNVGCHSWGVAMVVQRLWPTCRKELLLAALQHDLGEQEMGDVPAPAKWRAPQVFAYLNEAEANASLDMGFHPYEQELTPTERSVLKLADILELCAYARYRWVCGELSARLVWENGRGYAMKLIQALDIDDFGVRESLQLLEEIENWGFILRPLNMGEPKPFISAPKYVDSCLCGGVGCNSCEPQGRG